jgi:glycosyltransferase involved in cell wall biosynthesis
MKIDFTVAIPTYNSAERISKVLAKLCSQIGVENIQWEIIIVDNNSTDDTAKIVQDYRANWQHLYPLKYYFEVEQGTAFARKRAAREAMGVFIGFLDDDNLPDADWVAAAYAFGQAHPQAGAYSGKIHGDFAVSPPPNFNRIQAFLAVREHGSVAHLFDPEHLRLPPGAALVVRRQAWLESVPTQPIFKGRVGNLLVGAEDYEQLLYMHGRGWEIWYNPAQQVDHQIPSWRLEKDYLLTISRACGLPTCQLRLINAKTWQKPLIVFRIILSNLSRSIRHIIKYKMQIKTDIVLACELEFYLANMFSPWYALMNLLPKDILPK